MLCLQKHILSSAIQQSKTLAAKHCGPCREVSVLAGALASGGAAESDDGDTQAADRLTLCISLWTNGSWSHHCTSHSNHSSSFVPCVSLYMEVILLRVMYLPAVFLGLLKIQMPS